MTIQVLAFSTKPMPLFDFIISPNSQGSHFLLIRMRFSCIRGFHCGSAGKESTCNVGDLDSIPGLGRSPREGNGNPLQYSNLENSKDCIVSPWGRRVRDS